MYKNNDEAIDLEAKRLLDNGIYTDLEKRIVKQKR